MTPSNPDRPRLRHLASGWALLPLVILASGRAGADPLVDRQAVITLRALAYDNNLAKRAGGSLAVAVLYKEGHANSVDSSRKWTEALGKLGTLKVQGMSLQVVRLAYTDAAALKGAVAAQGLDALFVCEGLEAEVEALKTLSRAAKVLTITSSAALVEKGLSLGIVLSGDKNTILINAQASAEEGVSFGSDLLRLATMVKQP
ncbi:YfiR family protein [Pyxidicoccus parkwayensis]|uniref:YfiR family protein n=1 Tax=Pyxidicoccus parkwayensis TaxID=2813578 RepID=A0ABX7P241_9BACT|nr:YfiR family protein [Pyxidicoccus parkwaysis]QSQ24334.1 YfiR family protein [Pyxidicoccus parkwaysis]